MVRIDMRTAPERPDWPGWNHVGQHEALGRLFWNSFFEAFEGCGTLHFHDAPDFSGTITFPEEPMEQHVFYGDIGQVSVSTFVMDVVRWMRKGDLWISVPDERTQIILEALVDFQRLIGETIERVFGISASSSKSPNKADDERKLERLTPSDHQPIQWMLFEEGIE